LREYAESLNPELDFEHYKNKLNKLHSEIDSEKKSRNKGRLVNFGYYVAAAVILVAVMTIAFVFVKRTILSPETTVYVTSKANKGQFTLPDGSSVFLNSSSRLEVSSTFNGKKRSVKLDGEAYFDVANDASHPFEVISDLATIHVLGTAFNIKAYSADDFAEVVLVRGSLEVSGGNLPEPVVMKPNDMITITGTTNLVRVDVENYISWTGHPLNIDNKSLGDILTTIAHWYNVEFIANGEVNLSSHLTFVVRDESLESILNQISLVTPFKYNVRGNKVYYSTR